MLVFSERLSILYIQEENRMKEYEAVWEIFNSCANNQMRDVFFEELELEDP